MNLLFLVAARRSGTTLLRLMLDMHPDVMWHRGWETVAEAIEAFEKDGERPQNIAVDGLSPFVATGLADMQQKLTEQLTSLAQGSGKKIVGATCHVGFAHLAKIWPNAKFIHLIRDPRDIGISNMKLGWSGHYYASSDTWVEAETAWNKLSPQLTSEQSVNIRYEDLISSPETELRGLCDFIGVPYADTMFDYVKQGKYSYPKKELAYRWKDKIREADAVLIEAQARPLMAAHGYEQIAPEAQYSPMQIAQFKRQDKWAKRRRRIKEKGFFYTVLTKITRTINLPSLNKVVANIDAKKRAKHLANLEKNY